MSNYARLTVNDRDLIVCTEHGDETVYVDLAHIAAGISGRWECGYPGCNAFRVYERPEAVT